jgi:hypothetical protein
MAGAYHFSYAGHSAANTGVAEAAAFLAVAKPYIKGGYLRPFLDVEDDTKVVINYPGKELGADGLTQWVEDFASEVKRQTGVAILLYLGNGYISLLGPSLASSYELFYPHYTEDSESDFPVAPWANWTLFQYSESGEEDGVAVDLDVFRGSERSLQSRLLVPMPQLSLFANSISGTIRENGLIQISVSAPGYAQIGVQASLDLVNWTDYATVSIDGGSSSLVITNQLNQSLQFFRIHP